MHPPDDIFPLPLVAFERYMLADDRPDYPMTFVMTVRLEGEIDRAAMEESLREVLELHPLLRAVIDSTNGRRPCWVSAGENSVTFDWNQESVPLQCPNGGAIDLASQAGLRAWARQGASRTELTFQFHHSSCDGIGAMRFITDVMRAYAIRTATGSDRPPMHKVDVSRLRDRAALGRRRETAFARFLALLRTFPLTLKFIARRPQPLASLQADSRDDSKEPVTPLPFPAIKCVVLSEAESKQLREAARRQGVTLNDLLLRDMFLTVGDWNKRSAPSPGWLRVLMPTNMRATDDDMTPAANLVSLSFITRHTSECRQPVELLAGIHRETSSIKRIRRGLYFIRIIEAAQTLCGKMPHLLVDRRCRASVVLSNLGDVGHWLCETFPHRSGRIVVGNLTLEGITAAPPIRPNTTAAILVYSYADHLNINILCDQRVFSPRQIEDLLCEYTARLHDSSITTICG